jgi:hypothetical protein
MVSAPKDESNKQNPSLKCLDVQSWRAFTPEEHRHWMEDVLARAEKKRRREKTSFLAVRQSLSPVDIYCYLKARFGEPNGFQTFLRRDDSDIGTST